MATTDASDGIKLRLHILQVNYSLKRVQHCGWHSDLTGLHIKLIGDSKLPLSRISSGNQKRWTDGGMICREMAYH